MSSELKPQSTVGQPDTSKTSSRHIRPITYAIRGVVLYDGWRPETVRIEGNYITGKLSFEPVDPSSWSTPPHLSLANLPSSEPTGNMKMRLASTFNAKEPELDIDPNATAKFVKKYGLLYGTDVKETLDETTADPGSLRSEHRFERPRNAGYADPSGSTPGTIRELYFGEQLSRFASAQELLRRAWGTDTHVIDTEFKTALDDGFELRAFEVICTDQMGKPEALLETQDLWKFICFLFLVDYAKGRPGICANPDCVTPYFLKKRRTQVICEQGECVRWAQRRYALRWWDSEGKKRRERAQAKKKRKGEKRQ